jgi:hypothetical protein
MTGDLTAFQKAKRLQNLMASLSFLSMRSLIYLPSLGNPSKTLITCLLRRLLSRPYRVLPTFTLWICFAVARGQGRWPAESIGRVSPFPVGSDRLPRGEAGPSSDRRSPLPGSQTGAGIPDRLVRPGQGIKAASWFLRANALDPGPEKASKTLTFISFTEREGGKPPGSRKELPEAN